MNNPFSSMRSAIIIVIVLFVVVIAHYTGLIRPLERLVQTSINAVGAPLYQKKSSSASWFSGYFCSQAIPTGEMQNRINALTEENARLNQSLHDLEQIKEISGYTDSHQQHTIIARVVGIVNQPGTHAFILDKGLSDGIKEQYAVIASNGILIGKTAFVTDTTSQLILLNDRRSTLAASLSNNAKATGLVKGEFGLGIIMDTIPSNETMNPSDIVVTSGFENGIPGGLVIGTIDQVHRNDAELFAKASISPPIRYDQLNIVSILLPQE